MNLYSCTNTADILKKSFDQKPIRKDGLVIQIHHTVGQATTKKCVRFLHSAFDHSGLLVANADIDGNIFLIDLSVDKFWCLPKFRSCSVIAFSPVETTDLITGTNKGDLYILDAHLGTIRGQLEGHNYPVKSISFANEQCLTASLTQAIIYDLKTFAKVHELSIESPTTLKQIFFMPVTNNILACFSDDHIHVWKHKSFTSFKKLLPTDWYTFVVKTIAVTRNGRTMVIAGISPKLIVFSLDSWTMTKILNLPDETTIKSADFISQTHDGGANKYLILLANNGLVHILDMEQSIVVYKICLDSEVISFASSFNGIHLSCVLKSGEVNIYKLSYFVELPPPDLASDPVFRANRKKIKPLPSPPKHPREELNLDKLRIILDQFGEYPTAYRSLIWSKLLCLPNNMKSFTTVINKGFNKCFSNLDEKYPLINKPALKNLKRLLSNLGNWCSAFCDIEFLPLFVFPFIKIFENDPMICFEAVITIIMNWCQHWFQYAPCAPINTLAMIENVLNEHDHPLLLYLEDKNVTSQIYAWCMLESAFTEVLSIKDWCILWDHILSNEPAFFLMVPVAYNILQRHCVGTFVNIEQFEAFYRNQNPITIKTLIAKCYYLLQHTSDENHPRKFLHDFVRLPKNSYPVFNDFSKVVLVDEKQQIEENATEEEMRRLQQETEKYKEAEVERKKDLDLQEEENRRLQMMEDMYQDKLLKERERKSKRKLQLSKMKTDLMEMQAESMEASRKKMEEINLNERKRELDRRMKSIEYDQLQDDIDIQQTEEDLSKHYVELLRQKTVLESVLLQSVADETYSAERDRMIERQRAQIKHELKQIQNNVSFNRMNNRVSIPLGVSIANDITQNIDMNLAKEMAVRNMFISASHGNAQILKMDSDARELENDVQNLLDRFTGAKITETNHLLNRLTNDVTTSDQMMRKDQEDYKSCLAKSAPAFNGNKRRQKCRCCQTLRSS